jgi:DNA polymerase III epsilon subunit-like protein
MVADAPTIYDIFAHPRTQQLLADSQPCGFNSPFDRQFVPPFLEEWSWPWFDGLSVVRVVDRYAKGVGRHKLAACCARHGIALTNAHSAGADARATGELFVKLAPQVYGKATLGEALHKQGLAEVAERHRFLSWLSKQPPKPEAQTNG